MAVHFRVHIKTPQLLQVEQKWQLPLQTDIFIPAAICYHILLEERSCCFHLAGPGEMMCVQVELALPGHCGWGMGSVESRLPRQLNAFLSTQTILQQLQSQKMGIMQGQIMQVRFLFCENHNSQDLCKSLPSFFCWGEVSSSSSMVFLVYFKKTVFPLLFLLLQTLFLINGLLLFLSAYSSSGHKTPVLMEEISTVNYLPELADVIENYRISALDYAYLCHDIQVWGGENPARSTAGIPWNAAIIDVTCRHLTTKLIRFLKCGGFKW